ncbi:hypothetical protein XA68_12499 [Ophiocordyceps unilateralis]|uniref:Uncharacterized protein n=1 Tax=Ophiocordyceps unilateralis TaxID=268505 RepID=A0A2A9PEI6_OPHUN|nr:hypothetical protein XA68_12499 [Ophiocordyceps unilateralis]
MTVFASQPESRRREMTESEAAGRVPLLREPDRRASLPFRLYGGRLISQLAGQRIVFLGKKQTLEVSLMEGGNTKRREFAIQEVGHLGSPSRRCRRTTRPGLEAVSLVDDGSRAVPDMPLSALGSHAGRAVISSLGGDAIVAPSPFGKACVSVATTPLAARVVVTVSARTAQLSGMGMGAFGGYQHARPLLSGGASTVLSVSPESSAPTNDVRGIRLPRRPGQTVRPTPSVPPPPF